MPRFAKIPFAAALAATLVLSSQLATAQTQPPESGQPPAPAPTAPTATAPAPAPAPAAAPEPAPAAEAAPAPAETAPAAPQPEPAQPAPPPPAAAPAPPAPVVAPAAPQGAQFKGNHERLNMHFAGGVAIALGNELKDLDYKNLGPYGSLGFDVVLVGPLAFSVNAGLLGFAHKEANALRDLHVGGGFRLRLLESEKPAASEDGGSAAGNLWIDAHFNYHNYVQENHAGFNVGLGYELALLKDFSIGPFARFQMVFTGEDPKYKALLAGLAISIGGQLTPPDSDQDGIEDASDKCPTEAEDKDGYVDDDGCPDADNDGDGVADAQDKCPDQVGVAAEAGCPALNKDDDGDGVMNDVGKCPAEAEDKDGFEDEDGCPDADNDKDNVPDASDKCPAEAEDDDLFEDSDGCPDLDNDNDGVPDAQDQCDEYQETRNGVEEEDGCPDYIKVEGTSLTLKQGRIEFAANSDAIPDAVKPAIEEIAALLVARPTLKLRIDAHTDNKGIPEKKLALSKKRAEAVKKIITDKGVDAARVTAEGLGVTKPIADNATADGRKANNRIEFTLIPE